MIPEEERKALREKTEELGKVMQETEEKLNSLPYRAETAQIRTMLEQLVTEMHRMEGNLQRMLKREEESESEGGNENGSY